MEDQSLTSLPWLISFLKKGIWFFKVAIFFSLGKAKYQKYWENFCYVLEDLIKTERQKWVCIFQNQCTPFQKSKKGIKLCKVRKYELLNLSIIYSNSNLDIGRLNYDLRLAAIDSSTISIFCGQIIRRHNVKFVRQNPIPDVCIKTCSRHTEKNGTYELLQISNKLTLCDIICLKLRNSQAIFLEVSLPFAVKKLEVTL